jgi:putative addiction module CopG family antidote
MTIQLPKKIETWVEEQVSSGAYSSREALILASLELLQREQQELMADLEFGLNDFEAGRFKKFDSREAFASEVLRRVKTRSEL